VTGNYLLAVIVNLQGSSAKQQIAQATEPFREGKHTLSYDSLRHFLSLYLMWKLTWIGRYLEALEARLTEQNRLLARINELETKLREVDPSAQILNKPATSTQFLTPPETASNINNQNQSSNVTLKFESPPSQSQSPPYPPYVDERIAGVLDPHASLHNHDQDAQADPGLFETGEAGKGWYLGSASGSNFQMRIERY